MRSAKQSRRREHGQVLLVAVTVIVILLVVGLFLFDLRGVIRLRARTQTAADAAVLTAAGWQGRSLNMIGELNLIRAATVLISDIAPFGDDTAAGLLESSEAVTQLQLRITYAGPLIAFAAAQQAAKTNGMRGVDSFTESVQAHIDNYLTSGYYASLYPPTVHGYDWLPAYEAMLGQITAYDVAARPLNSRLLAGTPNLTGPGAFLLMNPQFYAAVHARDYCWFYRMGLEPEDSFEFDDIIYDANESAYFPGSEFCHLYVDFAAATTDDATLAPLLSDRGLEPLPPDQAGMADLEWAVFDGIGDGYGWDATGLYDFINPYLRASFRPEYTYSGACSRMLCSARPSLLTGLWAWRYGQDESETAATDLGGELAWSGVEFGPGDSYAAHGARLSAAEAKLRHLRDAETVESVAGAKPFGALGEDLPPQAAGIVLPVFSAVRLIPTAVVRVNTIERDPFFGRFLIEYFGHPDYPDVPPDIAAEYAYYISAMAQFSDMGSAFRDGWNDFDAWREEWMAGPDLIPDTDDDRPDPCLPAWGGGGGGGSHGGPDIIH